MVACHYIAVTKGCGAHKLGKSYGKASQNYRKIVFFTMEPSTNDLLLIVTRGPLHAFHDGIMIGLAVNLTLKGLIIDDLDFIGKIVHDQWQNRMTPFTPLRTLLTFVSHRYRTLVGVSHYSKVTSQIYVFYAERQRHKLKPMLLY